MQFLPTSHCHVNPPRWFWIPSTLWQTDARLSKFSYCPPCLAAYCYIHCFSHKDTLLTLEFRVICPKSALCKAAEVVGTVSSALCVPSCSGPQELYLLNELWCFGESTQSTSYWKTLKTGQVFKLKKTYISKLHFITVQDYNLQVTGWHFYTSVHPKKFLIT